MLEEIWNGVRRRGVVQASPARKPCLELAEMVDRYL